MKFLQDPWFLKDRSPSLLICTTETVLLMATGSFEMKLYTLIGYEQARWHYFVYLQPMCRLQVGQFAWNYLSYSVFLKNMVSYMPCNKSPLLFDHDAWLHTCTSLVHLWTLLYLAQERHAKKRSWPIHVYSHLDIALDQQPTYML